MSKRIGVLWMQLKIYILDVDVDDVILLRSKMVG